jgi:hypothetical protein
MTVQINVMDGPMCMAGKDARPKSGNVHKSHRVNKNNIASGCFLSLPEDILLQDPSSGRKRVPPSRPWRSTIANPSPSALLRLWEAG